MKTYWVGPVVYVKIETNLGISGWGDLKGVDPRPAKVLVESLFELLDGENPTRIEYLWQKLFPSHRNMRGGALMVHSIAAIDIALWDLAGKLWNVPVYRLLGGPTRDRIRVYHTDKPQKVPPHGIYEHSGTPPDINRLVQVIARAREKVGPDGAVMFDAHSAVPPATLIQLAGALRPYDVLFIEEPAVPGNIEVFKRLKQHINIPLAVGEQARTIWDVIGYLHEGCADILQVDCAHTGAPDPFKPQAMRVWMWEDVPGLYPAAVFDLANNGAASRYSAMTVRGGPENLDDVDKRHEPRPAWDNILVVGGAATVGLNLKADFANAAILFHQPNREQPIKWHYGHAALELDGSGKAGITKAVSTQPPETKVASLTVSRATGEFQFTGGGIHAGGPASGVAGLSGDATPARNLRGENIPIASDVTTVAIRFPQAEAHADYAVFIEQTWLTNRAISEKPPKVSPSSSPMPHLRTPRLIGCLFDKGAWLG